MCLHMGNMFEGKSIRYALFFVNRSLMYLYRGNLFEGKSVY